MRNFLLLIRRFRNLILFIILEVISLVLISKSRNLQGMDITSSSNAVAGYFYRKQNDVVYYFQLRRLNDSLLKENARLRNELAINLNVDSLRDSVSTISVKVRDTASIKDTAKGNYAGAVKFVKYAHYHYIPARVINNSISNDKINFLTLNRGKNDGVIEGMAVVTNSGIVGRVAHVSAHYATVASVLSDRKVSAKLSDGTFGTVIWEPGSPDYVYMEKMPVTVPVKKGDTVLTTGYSYFPEQVTIGYVSKIDTVRASNTKNLKVRLSTNFRKLQYVYVVKDKMGEERQKLETATHTQSNTKQGNAQ